MALRVVAPPRELCAAAGYLSGFQVLGRTGSLCIFCADRSRLDSGAYIGKRRQRETKLRTGGTAGQVDCFQPAAIRLHDRSADGESNADRDRRGWALRRPFAAIARFGRARNPARSGSCRLRRAARQAQPGPPLISLFKMRVLQIGRDHPLVKFVDPGWR